MGKPLHEMTNEELWQLFPVIIAEHNRAWAALYESEKEQLLQNIGAENIERINHIGSTAVRGLPAKSTIDILVEIKPETDTGNLIKRMEETGYIFSPQPDNPPPHMMFLKGYTPEGFKGQAFHVHIRYAGDWDEIRFRDYLKAHPETAREYGQLKLRLKEKYEHDRDGYTQAKTGFIGDVMKCARKRNH